jgi:hypothetical protein
MPAVVTAKHFRPELPTREGLGDSDLPENTRWQCALGKSPQTLCQGGPAGIATGKMDLDVGALRHSSLCPPAALFSLARLKNPGRSSAVPNM